MKIKVIMIVVLLIFVTAACSNSVNSSIQGVEIIDLKNNNKHLFFYGSRHCNDKSDPMFNDIERYFYNCSPQVVLVEGYYNKSLYADPEEAILHGESAFVSYLAQKENIPLDTVEPSMEEQYKNLLDRYDKEKVLSMYVLRQLYQYQFQQEENKRQIQQLLQQFVSGMREKGFPLKESETTFEYIRSLLKPYLKVELNENNWTEVDAYSIVYNQGSEINDIYQEVYKIRNEHLKSTIEESLKEYDRVFVIMGSQHVIDERDNINQIFSRVTMLSGCRKQGLGAMHIQEGTNNSEYQRGLIFNVL